MFVGCPIFVRQGRGVLHTPHKTTRKGRVQDDGKGIFLGAGAFNIEGGGVAP